MSILSGLIEAINHPDRQTENTDYSDVCRFAYTFVDGYINSVREKLSLFSGVVNILFRESRSDDDVKFESFDDPTRRFMNMKYCFMNQLKHP